MRETVELRVREVHAALVFKAEEGLLLGSGSIRKVKIRADDPRFPTICRLDMELTAAGEGPLFLGWRIHRHYSSKELAAAELLHLWSSSTFGPAGEETQTAYDESCACHICGAGRRQVGDLTLDVRHIPKRADFAQTIASELVFSARVSEGLATIPATGLEFLPVRFVGPHGAITADWSQPHITSRPLEVIEPTRYGIGPCDVDVEGKYRCPLGHTAGLNLLSELHLDRSSWDGSDFCATRQFVGVKRGLLRPRPSLLVSQRVYQELNRVEARGIKVDVAHLH